MIPWCLKTVRRENQVNSKRSEIQASVLPSVNAVLLRESLGGLQVPTYGGGNAPTHVKHPLCRQTRVKISNYTYWMRFGPICHNVSPAYSFAL